MARFLFVVPPLIGHINPTISVARELELLGHDVAWVGHAHPVKARVPDGGRFFELPELMKDDEYSAYYARSHGLRGASALKFLWEDFLVPLARAMVAGVERAVDEFHPDAMIVDHQAIAGAMVARQRDLLWATSATTSASIMDPFAELPRVHEWKEKLLQTLMGQVGVAMTSDVDLSPHLVIAFSTRALCGADHPFPGHYHFVGPSITARSETAYFPWRDLDDNRPKVLISLGTLNGEAGARFYREVLEALGDQNVQMILVAKKELLPPAIPDNALIRGYVPQLALLPYIDAVVSHGGHNTVAESLAHGIPLVVAPIKDDQPIVAQQVVDAGAGIRVKFGRVRAPALRDAVSRVLHDDSFRRAAARICASFDQAGGAPRAAQLVAGLVEQPGQAVEKAAS